MKRTVILENVIVDDPIWLNHVDYLVKSVFVKSIKLRFQEVRKFEFLVIENHESYTYLKEFLEPLIISIIGLVKIWSSKILEIREIIMVPNINV